MSIKSYRELEVWKRALQLVIPVYKLTDKFPKEEQYGLISQMKRSSVSIPSNIAEGSRRGTRKDFRHFLFTAFGSGAELETQVEIAKMLHYGELEDYIEVENYLKEVMSMLNSLIESLKE